MISKDVSSSKECPYSLHLNKGHITSRTCRLPTGVTSPVKWLDKGLFLRPFET